MPTAPQLELVAAGPDDVERIEALMQFYNYDLSETCEVRFSEAGSYAIRPKRDYLAQPGTSAYLMRVDGELAGFAIVDAECEHADSDFNLGYFFIARRFRGRGHGSAAVRQLFRLHRGNWEIYHLAANHPAGAFWQRVLAACAVDRLESSARTIHGEACVLFRFKV